MDPSSDTIIISDDSSGSVHAGKRKRRAGKPVKVERSDDTDVGHDAFKKRKKAPGKPSAKARWKGKEEPVSRKRRKGKSWRPEEDSDEELEDAVPEYIRERRSAFDEARKTLREAGLRLPPDYSDIYFSDDERPEHLQEKPQFDEKSGIKPCRDYKDIVLGNSAGVIPASIAQYLRGYQIEGVKFLHELLVYQKGGVLGDDMGLGKTVQVAAFLTAAFGKTGDQRDAKRMRKYKRQKNDWFPRALIICPGSLTQNWKNELDRWGWWVVDLYHGIGKEDILDTARAGRLEIMITTYTTYKNNSGKINRVPWDVVVADECHSIKDSRAGVTIAMNEVNALCRIGLTGTAIQNRYEELWTLLNWTNPGQFGTIADWRYTICKPLTIGQSHDATLKQLSEARKTAIKLRDNLLPRFFLRRMKSLIADQLPKKTDKVVFCPLSDLQRQAYENLLDSPLVEFIRTAYDECDCGSKHKRGWCCYEVNADGESWKSLVFPVIMSLQKLSSHFNLIIPQTGDVTDKQRRELRFLQAAMPDRWQQYYAKRESLLDLANPEFCGKWKILRKLLKFWHGAGDKVLVFSHSVRLLRILQHLFSNTSYSVSYLDGSLSYEDRQGVVDDFNSDPNQFVFLISTKAGGVGLNITSANKVVIMDPHWNPSYDLQAQDRAYRIGQTRDVDVFRLISTGTIEEITYARQIYKQQQANIGYNASNERRYFKGVQQDSSRKGEIFGIQNLLAYHGDQVVLRDIVNKTNVAEARIGVQLMDIDMDKAAKEDDEVSQFIKKEEGAEDETGGLKQLSAVLTSSDALEQKRKNNTKTDVVQAILASAGVEYTHENSEVVGTSRVEDELSRQAALAASQDGNLDAAAGDRSLFFDSQDHATAFRAPDGFSYEFNPPEDVMRRQFCTMARSFGFPGAVDFALAVEGMTQEQRRNCLDLFYARRLEVLRARGGVPLAKSHAESGLDGKTGADAVKGGLLKAEDLEEAVPVVQEGKEEVKKEVKEERTPATSHIKHEVKEEPKGQDRTSVLTDLRSEAVDVKVKVQRPSVSVWLSDDETDDEL
ncbi:hypothetical protein DL764_007734 [Monosporascus ibericus]|uniref:Helicase C-terminal domain-containing protein n=1 Tax=Monosporascus ibericus TaxID=155417 RepID=A0A4Q4SZA1_9PEZI|nr:hypothetical protein DL764_007734 [Monosporascus ibericus]